MLHESIGAALTLWAVLVVSSSCTVVFPVAGAGIATLDNVGRRKEDERSVGTWVAGGLLAGLIVDAVILASVFDGDL